MKYISWIITTPLTVLAILFIVSNQEKVSVKYWMYGAPYDVPLYVVGLAMLGVGFFCGALFVSLSFYALRHEYWKTKRRLGRLETELEKQQQENKENKEKQTSPSSNLKAIAAS